MATTTNFGWETPDDTDLVKDGAAAMRTLGNAIDTSLVDLKGGTTGQILSKASNTDLDYTWINNDQGDITGVTAGTGLTGGGTSGAVTLDFDVANYGGGQRAAGKNACINGDFRINQRGFTSTTTNSTYGFDRFILTRGTGGTVTYSAQTFTPGTAPVTGYEAINYARLVSASQSATSDRALLQQRIEDARTFANQTVTLSFWAKASTGTPNIAVEITQTFGTGGSPSSAVTGIGAQKFAITSSWVRYTKTITVPSVSGKTFGTDANSSFLTVGIWISAGSDYNSRTDSLGNQDITVDIWGVQLEAGSIGTPFQTATGSIQGELAACQRYYQRRYGKGNGTPFGAGQCYSTTAGIVSLPFPVTLRATPSFASSGLYVTNSTFGSAGGTIAIYSQTSSDTYAAIATSASGLVAGNATLLVGTDANSYLELSAEL